MLRFPQDLDLIRSQVLTDPVSLMSPTKLQWLLRFVDQHQPQHITEVGSFALGTAYILARHSASLVVHSWDINQWDQYFRQFDHDQHLIYMCQRWPGIEFTPESMPYLQEIYLQAQPNLHSHTGSWLESSHCTDLVIIDGDHRPQAVREDILHSLRVCGPGSHIIVDDCLVGEVALTAVRVCQILGLRHEFACWQDYQTMQGSRLQGPDFLVISC